TEGWEGNRLSTYKSGPDGGKALADAYRAAGRPVGQLRTPFTGPQLARLPKGVTLFVMAPSVAVSGDEGRSLREWVERGGRAVLAFGSDRQTNSVVGDLVPGARRLAVPTGLLAPAGPAPEAIGWHELRGV